MKKELYINVNLKDLIDNDEFINSVIDKYLEENYKYMKENDNKLTKKSARVIVYMEVKKLIAEKLSEDYNDS